MADSAPPDDRHQQSPWSRPAVLFSGAFLLALILAGILVAVTGGGSGHAHHRTQQPVGVPASTTSSVPTISTACTLRAGAQVLPSTSPPAGTQWAAVGSMQAPQAPSLYGPQRTESVFNTCFAHSPSGALLAAINLWAESTAAGPSQVFQKLAVGAPHDLGNNARLDASGPVQLAGYRIGSYTPNRADIWIVLKGVQGRLVVFVTPVIWNGSDWRYRFPPHGVPSLQVISDLTGYVAWSAF